MSREGLTFGPVPVELNDTTLVVDGTPLVIREQSCGLLFVTSPHEIYVWTRNVQRYENEDLARILNELLLLGYTEPSVQPRVSYSSAECSLRDGGTTLSDGGKK
jgi:hypothetical protein